MVEYVCKLMEMLVENFIIPKNGGHCPPLGEDIYLSVCKIPANSFSVHKKNKKE